MQIDIKCGECGKGTKHFELGKIFYSINDLSGTIIGKNRTICPKCKKDISDNRCLVKKHELYSRLVAANLCLAMKAEDGTSVPKHLKGAFALRKRDYELIKSECKTMFKLVDGF